METDRNNNNDDDNNNNNRYGVDVGLPVHTVGGLWEAVLAPAWLLAAPRHWN